MTKRTPSTTDRTTKWGLFRKDAEVFDNTTVLKGEWYATQLDAQKGLEQLRQELPALLKQVVIIKEVAIDPADRKRTHQFVAVS